MMSHAVVAVVATYQRPRELARLLASLSGVERVVVCDNAGSDEVRDLVKRAGHDYVRPEKNLGCGGGLRLAEEHAWKTAAAAFTHLLVLDDDVVLQPQVIPHLIAALDREGADAAYPLVTGPDGFTAWLPGLKNRALHRLGRTPMRPDEYRSRAGVRAADFTWAQGICLLARRTAVEAAGFHRDDFWVRGEDLDFSLRLTAQGRGILVPDVEVAHLPPTADVTATARGEYLRHAALVQNVMYLALTQPHGRRILRSVPSTAARFLQQWGTGATLDLVRAFYRGAIKREPAGAGSGQTFQRRFESLGGR